MMRTIRFFALYCASLVAQRVSEEVWQASERQGGIRRDRDISYGQISRQAMSLACIALSVWKEGEDR